jgi:hypothetical protein
MPNRIATFSVLAALAMTPALAQQTPTTPQAPQTPQATQDKPAAGMAETFISSQSADQFLASKLIGLSVTGPDNQKIGSVNDLLFEKDGSIKAAVIGVGGFLGIGEKNVALSFKSLTLTRSPDGDKAVLKVSKAELEKAPDFKAYQPPRPAAQRPIPGPGATPRPGPGGGATQ